MALEDMSVANVGNWLDQIELGQYTLIFEKQSIDGSMLVDLVENDKYFENELGIKMVLHRTKIIKNIKKIQKSGYKPIIVSKEVKEQKNDNIL